MRLSPKQERDSWFDRLKLRDLHKAVMNEAGFIRPFDMFRPTKKDFYSYKINQSVRFNDNDTANMTATPGASPTDNKIRSTSFWIKRCNLGLATGICDTYVSGSAFEGLKFDTSDRLQWVDYNGGTHIDKVTSQVFRDATSWYHILIVLDTTEAVQADRTKMYCNGVEITDFDTNTSLMALNATHAIMFLNNPGQANVGLYYDASQWGDCYISEFINVDGQALSPTDFGELKTNGVWVPKKYTGTYGNNGFYLDFSNSADFGEDQSGNGNDFTDSNLAANDQVLDSPTNNYCTLNSVAIGGSTVNALQDGNLEVLTESSTLYIETGTIQIPSSGKWVFEGTLGGNAYGRIGIILSPHDHRNNAAIASAAASYGYAYDYFTGAFKYEAGSSKAYGDSFTAGDVIRVEVNMDDLEIEFFKNNVSQGVESISGDYDYLPAFCDSSGSNNCIWVVDFGQHGFSHTPTSGFKSLCSANLPEPDILNPADGFEAVLYEGTGAVQSITSLGFQPNLVWIKNRDAADEHKLIDSVRGATEEISSDKTAVEGTDANGLTAFLSNGFSLGTGAGGYNDNAESFVAWCFRMGAKYGIDVQGYLGTGVAHAESHDLAAIPELILVKNRDVANNWAAYHHHALNKTDPETDYGILNTGANWADSAVMWNDVAPTASQFTVGTGVSTNTLDKNYIAYLFRSISGFSRVFSYDGNGSADGTFVYCGFQPRYILIKKADTAINTWMIYDTARNTYNPATKTLPANDVAAEEDSAANNSLDIVSNGFKPRVATARVNTSGALYVGIAFAEQPEKYSNAR